MFRRAQDRIRTYYYKTKDELLKNKDLPPEQLKILLADLQGELKSVNSFGCYFDRTYGIGDIQLKSLCDETGKFSCHGRWDKMECLYKSIHSINPYSSKEERLVFQTWNLDHTIERSRAIVPAICEALIKQNTTKNGDTSKRKIDTRRIFDDLFTLNNLKFVHIVCHDKGAHNGKIAGPYLM